jgi:hypothetical protein
MASCSTNRPLAFGIFQYDPISSTVRIETKLKYNFFFFWLPNSSNSITLFPFFRVHFFLFHLSSGQSKKKSFKAKMSQFLLLILEDTKPQTVPGLLGLLRSPPDGRRQYLSPVKSSAESFDQDDLLSTPSREDLTNPLPQVSPSLTS